jgi:hypothetical protein
MVEEAVSVKPRNTLIVVALFAAQFAYVWFVEDPKTPDQLATPTKPSPIVFQLDAMNVKSIEVRDLRTPRTVKLSRAGSEWQVEQPAAKPGDSGNIDTTLGQLATLHATRVLTNVTDLAPFGFVTPTIEVRLVMSDTTPYAITVGSKTPDQSNYYVIYTGDKQVFVVNGFTIDGLVAWLDTPPYLPTPVPTVPLPPTETATPAAPPGVIPTLLPATETPKP